MRQREALVLSILDQLIKKVVIFYLFQLKMDAKASSPYPHSRVGMGHPENLEPFKRSDQKLKLIDSIEKPKKSIFLIFRSPVALVERRKCNYC